MRGAPRMRTLQTPATSTPRVRGVAAAIAIAVALLALTSVGAASADPAGAAAGTASHCRDVVVQFEPEGSGGAMKIRAHGVKCNKARKVARSCIKSNLKPGWSAAYADIRIRLTKADRKITYVPVGGGGCVPG